MWREWHAKFGHCVHLDPEDLAVAACTRTSTVNSGPSQVTQACHVLLVTGPVFGPDGLS